MRTKIIAALLLAAALVLGVGCAAGPDDSVGRSQDDLRSGGGGGHYLALDVCAGIDLSAANVTVHKVGFDSYIVFIGDDEICTGDEADLAGVGIPHATTEGASSEPVDPTSHETDGTPLPANHTDGTPLPAFH